MQLFVVEHALELVEQLPLTARPNKAALNKKHRKIYVGIAAAPFVDVFDLDTHEKLTKKEVLRMERLRAKLERNLGGIKDMPKLPGAIFVVDPAKEYIAINEARRLGIPVVAVAASRAPRPPW